MEHLLPLYFIAVIVLLPIVGCYIQLRRILKVLEDIADDADYIRCAAGSIESSATTIAQPFHRAQDAEFDEFVKDQMKDKAAREERIKALKEAVVDAVKQFCQRITHR